MTGAPSERGTRIRFPWFTPPGGASPAAPEVTPQLTPEATGTSSAPEIRRTPSGASAAYRHLFDEGFMRRLERLQLISQRMHGAASHGGRRSKKRGSSVEFADYREYTRGDDLRQIDWNVYGRSERLYVKLREDEESLTVHVLVDCSRSMDFGRHNKLAYAQRLAAALGYVALCNQDQVEISGFGERVISRLPSLRAKAQTNRLFTFCSDLRPAGATDIKAVLRAYASMNRRSGMAILISDLLNPGGLEGLAALQDRGFEAVLLHLLDPLETDPEALGEVELRDREDGSTVRLSMDALTLDAYRRRLNSWIEETEAFCIKRQVRYVAISTGTPLDDLIFRQLRARRIVT